MRTLRRVAAFLFACGSYGVVDIGDTAARMIVGPCMKRAYHDGLHRAMGVEWP